MPTMIVLVNLKEDVAPADYERWVVESYAPATSGLPSVEDWRHPARTRGRRILVQDRHAG
jgi:hypothetical protein